MLLTGKHQGDRPGSGCGRAHGGVSCEPCAGQAGAEFAGAGGGVGTGAPAWGHPQEKNCGFPQ